MVGGRVRVEHRLGMNFSRPNLSRVPRCSLPAPSSQDLAVCCSRYDRKFVSLMTIRYREVYRQSQTADKLKLCRVLVSKHSQNANSSLNARSLEEVRTHCVTGESPTIDHSIVVAVSGVNSASLAGSTSPSKRRK